MAPAPASTRTGSAQVPSPTKTRPPKPCSHCGQTHRSTGKKQRRFITEYLKDLNATQAAIRAGYSHKSADTISYQLLQKKPVACEVQRRARAVEERAELTAVEVIEGLRAIACVDLSSVYDANGNLLSIHDWPDEVKRVVTGMETDEIFAGAGDERRAIGQTKKLKIPDRIKAFELLGKYLALWKEVHHHEGEITLEQRLRNARHRAMKS